MWIIRPGRFGGSGLRGRVVAHGPVVLFQSYTDRIFRIGDLSCRLSRFGPRAPPRRSGRTLPKSEGEVPCWLQRPPSQAARRTGVNMRCPYTVSRLVHAPLQVRNTLPGTEKHGALRPECRLFRILLPENLQQTLQILAEDPQVSRRLPGVTWPRATTTGFVALRI